MSLETYVFVHNQQLVLDCEIQKTFSHLQHYKYVFLGKNGVSKLESLGDRVIVARNLPTNIEQHPLLVAFTGWYALAENNIIQSKHVALLEYDVTVTPTFEFNVEDVCARRAPCMVGFRAYALKSDIFFNATPLLIPVLKQVYDIDVVALIDEYVKRTGKNAWASSSNMAMDTETFKQFVKWFMPIAEAVKEDPMGAHMQERCFRVWCIVNKVPMFMLPHVLEHAQKKSHHIEALV